MLGGICAGIANRLDVDPTIVRIVAILLAIVSAGVVVPVIYLALWIIIPTPPPGAPPEDARRPSRDELTEEFREAGGLITEAGRIVGRATKQAAADISEMQRQRAAARPHPTPSADGPVGDEAAGAQAVNEEALAQDTPPGQPEVEPSGASPSSGERPPEPPLPPGGTPQGSDTMPTPPSDSSAGMPLPPTPEQPPGPWSDEQRPSGQPQP